MARPKVKDNKAITIRMDSAIVDRLNAYCEASGQSKTLAIERAIVKYMDEYDNKMRLLASIEETDQSPKKG